MSVQDAHLISTFVGLSTDTKPTSNVQAGSRFLERDTGVEYVYDGSAWGELLRNTEEITLFASAARNADENSADQTNLRYRGLHLILDVTAFAGDDSFTFTIQGKDPASGKYYDLLASAAISTTGTTVLKLYPGLTAAANSVENDLLPRTWRVKADYTQAGAAADTLTFSVGAVLIR